VKILADESVDFPVVKLLRCKNFTIDYITEIKPGISDDQVINLAKQKERILLTADKDFGELIYRLNKVSAGIILYRLPGFNNKQKARLILKILQDYDTDLPGSFTVITKKQVRIKKISS
jgi:predicted nuclease of predicted toxin-antitoxin system